MYAIPLYIIAESPDFVLGPRVKVDTMIMFNDLWENEIVTQISIGIPKIIQCI